MMLIILGVIMIAINAVDYILRSLGFLTDSVIPRGLNVIGLGLVVAGLLLAKKK